MLIDIVILPPKKIREKIGKKIKKEIGSSPHYFVVDNIRLIPHLSLWHINTSKKNLILLSKKLENLLAKKQKPLKIGTLKFHSLEKYKGCVEFPVKNNKDLIQLQQKVFNVTYPLKTRIMPLFASILNIKYSKEELREIKKYGRSLEFGPHFTMGWLKKEKNLERIVNNMKGVKFNFTAKEIYVCEINKWWQVKKIIKKINF